MSFTISANDKVAHTSLTVNDLTSKTVSKNSKKFASNALDTIIIHYTAGRDALSSANYLAKPEVGASAHLVIGREGEVYQLVPFDIISWHAGKSNYGGRKWFNNYSIGIEIDNAGILTKVGSQYQAWFGKKYPESEVMRAIHRNEKTAKYWHTYTETQIEVVTEIVKALVVKYNIKHILGHEEISPGRKQDPGPAFDLDRFRNSILGTNRNAESQPTPSNGTVNVSVLNIRKGPGSNFEKVAKPLKDGQKVKILEESNGWYKVETKVTGWVSKGYIK